MTGEGIACGNPCGHGGNTAGTGDASACGRIGLVAPYRDVPDGHTGDIGDRVRRTRVEAADAESMLAEPRAARRWRAHAASL